MGKAAKKIELCSKHYSKEQIEAKKSAEIKLGIADLKSIEAPPFVKNDATAYKYWKKHIKEYEDAAKNNIEILTSSDVGSLAIYCKTYSEYENFLALRAKNDSDVDVILKLETAINKKMDMLIKLQDRLFLNPLARVRSVPPKQKEKPNNPLEGEYGI